MLVQRRPDLSARFWASGQGQTWLPPGNMVCFPTASLFGGSPQRHRRKSRGGMSLQSQHRLASHRTEKHAGRCACKKQAYPVALPSPAFLGLLRVTPKCGTVKTAQWSLASGGSFLNVTLMTSPRLSSCFAAVWKFSWSDHWKSVIT